MSGIYENCNATDSPLPPFDQIHWLVSESILVLLTVANIYTLVCLAKFARKKDKNDRRVLQTMKQKTWLQILPFVISLLLMLRLVSDHVIAFASWQDDTWCFVNVTVSTVLLSLGLVGVYLFLWIRQSIFYADKLMSKIINPKVIVLSWFTLGFMLVNGVIIIIAYNVPQLTGWEYRSTNCGCMEVSEDSPEIVPIVASVSTSIFQVALLALFIYPLMSRRTEDYRVTTGNPKSKSEKYQTSALSNSGETPSAEKDEENDDVFADNDMGTSSTGAVVFNRSYSNRDSETRDLPRKVSKSRLRTLRSETDTESGADIGRPDNDKVWGRRNVTVKREPYEVPEDDGERKPRRKSCLARLKSLGKGSRFYKRAQSNSISSENFGSPATSDSEMSTVRKRHGGVATGTLGRLRRKKNTERGKRLVMMMKKYTGLMIVCVVTDLIMVAIQVIEIAPEILYVMLFDVSLFVNLICVVLTYSEWKTILFPFLQKKPPTPIVRKPRRKPATPIKIKDRVQFLRETERAPSRSSSRRSSGSLSGYESADSHGGPHIYRREHEMRSLIRKA